MLQGSVTYCELKGGAFDDEKVNPDYYIRKDKEYIVFLELVELCGDDDNPYTTLYPVINASCDRDGGRKIRPYLIFPIKDGKVDDSGTTTLGFGNNLSIDDYKTKLRAAINAIKNP